MRRSMIPMLVTLLTLSTPLAGQSGGRGGRGGRGAWVFGFAGTLGGGWQVEAADVGYARVVAAGPLRVATLAARVGSFIDEGAIIGGSRGFLAGLIILSPLVVLGVLAYWGRRSYRRREEQHLLA